MKNGDYIRQMDDDRLQRFLWTWGINTISSFLQFGGMKLMDAKMIREWLDSEDFEREETKVHEEFIFNQEFNLR